MLTTRLEKVICKCGHTLDATTAATGNAIPKEDDLSLCLQCGAFYLFKGTNFRLMTDQEYLDLPMHYKEMLNKIDKHRREVVSKRRS